MLVAIALTGCAMESELHPIVDEPQPPELSAADPKASHSATVPKQPTWDVTVHEQGSATQVWLDPQRNLRREVFDHGAEATTPIVDYLFVVDDSVSMEAVLEPLRKGVASLAQDAFPAQARIGVMTMTPADPDQSGVPHPVAKMRGALQYNPGFMGLVDHDGLVRYRQVLDAEFAGNVASEGCAAWFSPGDTTASGEPCLQAHTRLGLTPNMAEAGLTSLKQLLQKQGDEPIFRQGAAVNVVFVSDTHDPGFVPEEDRGRKGRKGCKKKDRRDEQTALYFDAILDTQPSLGELERLVGQAHEVASLTFHAIAPMRDCAERWEDWLAPIYHDLAAESGGVSLDICTATDYGPVVGQIVTGGATNRRSVHVLSEPAREIEEVRVGGRPARWSLSHDNVLTIEDQPLGEPRQVEVIYRSAVDLPAPESRPGPRLKER